MTDETPPESVAAPERPTWMRRSAAAWALLAVALVAAAGAGLAVYAGARARVEAVARPAREAVDARKFAEARPLVERWEAAVPGDPEAAYYLARVEVGLDRPSQALDAMRKASGLGHPSRPLTVLQAILQSRAGRYEEAEPTLLAAFVNREEPQAEVAEGLARGLMRTARLAEANTILERWKTLAPDDARPFLWRAEVEHRVGTEFELLVRDYREALRRDPNLHDARLALADKLRETSSIDEAGVEYAELVKRKPDSAPGLIGQGKVAMLKGDLRAAEKAFEAANKADPTSPVALRELALLDLQNGRAAAACDRLEQAVKIDPYDYEVRFSYARALMLVGKKDKAAEQNAVTEKLRKDNNQINDLRKSLTKNPNDLDLRGQVAKWLIEHGHEKEGLEWTGLILAAKPDHPATCRLLADYHAAKGNAGLANYYRSKLPESERGTTKP